jgi:spore germination protein YaaH
MNSARRAAAVLLFWLPSVACTAAPPVAHFYFTTASDSVASLQAHAASIELASPAWLTIDVKGLESAADDALVSWAAAHAVGLMPLVVNRGFDPQAAAPLLRADREALVTQLVEMAAKRRFRGLQLDLEGLLPADRADYIALARLLARELHRRRLLLAVAVPAPLWPGEADGTFVPSPFAEAFDYAELGRAVDFVTLMAYDEHTSADAPGAIAGRPWVESCLARTLQAIPAKKLMLGVPLYHRVWSGDKVSDGTWADAVALAKAHSAEIQWDPLEREKTFRFLDGEVTTLGFLHDADTLRERLELVRRHHLRGFSAWRLGQEDPEVWRPDVFGKKR